LHASQDIGGNKYLFVILTKGHKVQYAISVDISYIVGSPLLLAASNPFASPFRLLRLGG